MSPGTEYSTNTHVTCPGRTPGRLVSGCESVRGVRARAASTRRFTKFLAHPEPSLPPVDCAAGRGGGGGLSGGGREEAGGERGKGGTRGSRR